MQFVGRAPQKVAEFLAEVVAPIRAEYVNDAPREAEVQV